MKFKGLIICAVAGTLVVVAFFVGRSMRGGGESAASDEPVVTQSAQKIADAGRRPRPLSTPAVKKPKPVLDLSEADER